MKITCDRCLKIVSEDSIEVARNWLNISTDSGLKYLFCEKCADVFWDTMFSCDKNNNNSDGACVGTVHVVHGHWISVDDKYSATNHLYFPFRCSVCNVVYWLYKPHDLPINIDFCPTCGAKMDEEGDFDEATVD